MKYYNKIILFPWFIKESKSYMKGNKKTLVDWFKASVKWFSL